MMNEAHKKYRSDVMGPEFAEHAAWLDDNCKGFWMFDYKDANNIWFNHEGHQANNGWWRLWFDRREYHEDPYIDGDCCPFVCFTFILEEDFLAFKIKFDREFESYV